MAPWGPQSVSAPERTTFSFSTLSQDSEQNEGALGVGTRGRLSDIHSGGVTGSVSELIDYSLFASAQKGLRV